MAYNQPMFAHLFNRLLKHLDMPLNNTKLKRFIQSTLIITIPMIMMAYVTVINIQQIMLNENETFLKSVVENSHLVIEQFLDERMSMLKSFASQYPVTDIHSDTKLHAILDNWKKNYGDFESIAILTPKGQTLSHAGKIDVVSTFAKENDWHMHTLNLGYFISGLFYGEKAEPNIGLQIYQKKPDKPGSFR